MPTYYPQIFGNLILTQLPYSETSDWATLVADVESGMRYSFPTRGAGLSGYPSGPLGQFAVNYSSITDAEVNVLDAFFASMNGQYGAFRFLSPMGNLLAFSELFTNAAWTVTFTPVPGLADPFGGTRAYSVSSGSMKAVVGPSDGGMAGMVMCASIWVRTPSSGVTATIGFVDESTSASYTKTVNIGNGWSRIFYSFVLPTNNQFVFYFSCSGTAVIFGAQTSPTKGESAYVETPGSSYGYHEYCRFDTDNFLVQTKGPNDNQLSLPIAEFNGA